MLHSKNNMFFLFALNIYSAIIEQKTKHTFGMEVNQWMKKNWSLKLHCSIP